MQPTLNTVKKNTDENALPPPEEILMVRQRSDFFNDDKSDGVNWNNDGLVRNFYSLRLNFPVIFFEKNSTIFFQI